MYETSLRPYNKLNRLHERPPHLFLRRKPYLKKWISSLTLMFLLLLAPTAGAAPHTYTDVPTTHPAYTDVMFLVELGVVPKTTSYGLNKTVTREDVAVMMAKALRLENTPIQTTFRDIPATHRAAGYIQSAVDAGVIKGYTDRTFRPNEPVTRGQMAAFLVRGFKLDTFSASKFKDVTQSMAFYDDVRLLVGTNITNGYSDGTFRPNAVLKKDQVSMFMARAYRYAHDITRPLLTVKEVVQMNDAKIVTLDFTSRWGDVQGSGILLGKDLILTNHHVANQATSGTATFSNGKVMDLEGFIYFDKRRDFALLRTKGTYTTLGVILNSSRKIMEKGDAVIAIGSPLGLQNTVSTGIVSGFRDWQGIPAIQTTAGIDFGSSGGGLFNMYGELIGMTSGGYNSNASLNFAIPTHVFHGSIYGYRSFPYPGEFEPYVSKLAVPDIGGVKLGMSKDQVKALNLGGTIQESEDELYITDATILGRTSDLELLFLNDNLILMNMTPDHVFANQDLASAEAYFEKMHDEIRAQLGRADEADRDWTRDAYGSESWEAYWAFEDFDLVLTMERGAKGIQSNLFIAISWLFEE